MPRRLVDAIPAPPTSCVLRAATVTGTPGSGAVELSLGGGTVEASYLSTYTPTVGDVVVVLQQGSQLLVLGIPAS
jgi:hypothetical protein